VHFLEAIGADGSSTHPDHLNNAMSSQAAQYIGATWFGRGSMAWDARAKTSRQMLDRLERESAAPTDDQFSPSLKDCHPVFLLATTETARDASLVREGNHTELQARRHSGVRSKIRAKKFLLWEKCVMFYVQSHEIEDGKNPPLELLSRIVYIKEINQ
jgi:hypothetical protein